jgi:NAD(P)-dependent dehydrogenase (short-subunit alcohol dehydrogenase family)
MVRSGGSVVNVSSVHAYDAMVEHSVYAATKAAILGFTRTRSLELIQKNVRVNCGSIERWTAMS